MSDPTRTAGLVYGLAVIDTAATQNALRTLREQPEPADVITAVVIGCIDQSDSTRIHFRNAAHTAAAYAVTLALENAPLDRWLPRLLDHSMGMDATLDAALYRVGHAGAWGSHAAAVKHIGSATLNEQVALALYHLIRYPDDYTAAVTAAQSTTHTTTLLTSALSAARLGIEAIPPEWIAALPDRATLDALIADLNPNSEG